MSLPIHDAPPPSVPEEETTATVALGIQEGEPRQEAPSEMEIRRKWDAEEAATTREEVRNFAHILSHDLRAPLVNIVGFANEMRQSVNELTQLLVGPSALLPPAVRADCSRLLEQDMRESLEFIFTGVSRMDRLINEIIRLSRPLFQALKPEPVDLQLTVHEVLNSLRPEFDEAGATVTVEASSLPVIVADRNSIQRIVSGLLSCTLAKRAAGRPLELTISASVSSQGTILHFKDNGRGMTANEVPRAFGLLDRLGMRSSPGADSAAGADLATVQSLVRRHGGLIWCETAPHEGSAFHIFIPLAAGRFAVE